MTQFKKKKTFAISGIFYCMLKARYCEIVCKSAHKLMVGEGRSLVHVFDPQHHRDGGARDHS